jgi:hypothetical protein
MIYNDTYHYFILLHPNNLYSVSIELTENMTIVVLFFRLNQALLIISYCKYLNIFKSLFMYL